MSKPAMRPEVFVGSFLLIILIFWFIPMRVAHGEDIYVFQDAEGTLHYATLSRIPPSYRKSASLYLKEHQSSSIVRRRLSRRETSALVFPKKRSSSLQEDSGSLSLEKGGWRSQPSREGEDLYDEIIFAASRAYGIDFSLLKAVIRAESNFNPKAVSPKGACGLMQLMPSTAQDLGVRDVFDPEENIHAGTRYLKWLYEIFEEDWTRALAAYNAGPSRVGTQGIPDIRETHDYVRRVGDFYRIYHEKSGLRVVSK